MDDMNVPRRTAVDEQPRYSALEPLTFQSLCKEILQADPKYRNVQVFGVSGQGQKGIDILAEQLASSGLTVGQCKRYQTLTGPQIAGAVKEFIKYKDYWKKEGTDTFVLFVSCDATNAKVLAEFLRQKRRLKRIGIAFELWSDSTLTGRLRSHPGIISQYLGGDWPLILCGGTFVLQATLPPHTSQLIVTQYEQLSVHYADSVERDLETARESWRSGDRREAQAAVDRYRQPQIWNALVGTTRSSVCRIEAQIALEDGQAEQARKLLGEAKALNPDVTPRLEALVLRSENHRDQARQLLQDSADIENIALYTGLCLELGDIDAAFAKLTGVADTTDTHRLRALTYLMKGDLPSATKEIEKALMLAPTWTVTRYTAAAVDYYSCLSPNRPLEELPPWPEPADWSQLKSDDDSRARLAKSATTFRLLQNEPNTSVAFGRLLMAWELACIASDPTRREDANRRCAEILTQDPANEPCLVWAKARRLDVDTTQPRAILERKVRGDEAPAESTIVLLICLIEERDLASAKTLLEESRDRFDAIGHRAVWKFWHDQISAMNAEGEFDSNAASDNPFQKTALRAHLRTTGDAKPLLMFLAEEHAAGKAEATFELCAAYAEFERWPEALPLVEPLLARIQTTEALRIGCTILYRNGEFARCAKTIEDNRYRFPASQLPQSFLQMKIGAQERSGEVLSAIRTAEDALAINANRANFLNLANLYLESGDFAGLTQLASRHERFPDLSNQEILRLSARLATVNQSVGVSLWKRAVKTGISDGQVGAVISIGFNLGLDMELGEFMQRMAALPEGSGFQRIDVQQFIDLATARNEAANTTYQLYRSGATCLQAALDAFGNQLSTWYQRRLEDNRASSSIQHPTYARNGWRSRYEVVEPASGRLCADLTSLMLAQYLGVLLPIVEAYRPIRIPHGTVLALASMREAVGVHQPTRITNLRGVQDAVLNQKISVIAVSSSSPVVTDCLDIDYPVPGIGDVQGVSRPAPRTIVSPCIVINGLARMGKLSAERKATALSSLGPGAVEDESTVLEEGANLLIGLPVLEAFSRANILSEVFNTFTVRIRLEEARFLTDQLTEFARSTEDADWLSRLIETINKGLEAKDFQLLPVQIEVPEDDESPGGGGKSLATRCMVDLLTYKNDPNDLIWIDDRAMNSFVHRDGTKLVDTIDTLNALRKFKRLNDDDYFRCLHRYRDSGLRFLSLRSDELLYWLDRATTPNGSFNETHELLTMRLNHARALQDATALRTASTVDGTTLEWPFLLDSATAIVESMRDVWKSDVPKPMKERRCSWLVDNLLLLDRGRSNTVFQSNKDADLSIEAITLGELVVSAFGMFDLTDRGREQRRDYLTWAYYRVLHPRFDADERLKEMTLVQMTQMLLALRPHKQRGRKVLAAISVVIHTWIEDLPEELRSRFITDNGLLNHFGVSVVGMVSVGKLRFKADQFWRAVRDLVRTKKTVALGGARLFPQARNGFSVLSIEDLTTGEIVVWDEAPLELMSTIQAQQLDALNVVKKAFDLSTGELELLRQKLRTESPDEILPHVARLRDESANHFYQALDSKLANNASITNHDLIPQDVRMLLRHLRLETDAEEPAGSLAKEDFAASLAAELSLQIVMERLISLPRPIPAKTLAELEKSTPEERRSIVRHLAKLADGNPIALAHVTRLLYIFAGDNRAYMRWGDSLVRQLLSFEGSPALGAMMQVLTAVERELSSHEPFSSYASATRLLTIWSHVSRLQRIFVARHVDLSWVENNFGNDWNRLPAELFGDQSEFWRDVSHPSRVEPSRLLASLVYYATVNGNRLQSSVQEQLMRAVGVGSGQFVDLLFDASHEPDAIGSILSESSGWLSALDDDTRSLCLAARHPDTPKQIAEQLMNGGDPILWAHLHSVVKTGKIPDDAKEDMRTLLLTSDLGTLYNTSPHTAPLALSFAASHAGELGQGIVDKVRRTLLELASESTSQPESSRASKKEEMILSAALYLYRGMTSAESPFRLIGELWLELARISHVCADLSRGMVDRLIEALPNSDSRHLWKLQVYIRSVNTNAETDISTAITKATAKPTR
jgi:tetratricopeptide (TPR) repeat protein